MLSERRNHTRYALLYKVICSPSENPAKKIIARSFNVSLGGIGLTIKDFLNENRYLNLTICTPKKDMLIRACGKLVWQSRSHDIAENRVGLKFTEIQYTKIKKLLAQAAQV